MEKSDIKISGEMDIIGEYAEKIGMSRDEFVKEYVKLTNTEAVGYNSDVYKQEYMLRYVEDVIIEREGLSAIDAPETEEQRKNAVYDYLIETALNNIK